MTPIRMTHFYARSCLDLEVELIPMYLPPLQATNNSSYHVSGDVTIHPSAAIAPGVLLQADPESRVIISAGVCIGMGAILHAYQGNIEVEEGANIGAGVLIVGMVKIGTNACIGSATTIFNSSIGRGEVVSPASLIGDPSRQTATTVEDKTTLTSASNQQVLPEQPPEDELPSDDKSPSDQAGPSLNGSGSVVYGQAHLNRLLSTLLPHRQAFKPATSRRSDVE